MPELIAIIGDDWRLVHDAPVGEFYLRQHLRVRLDEPRVSRMASGWGGDRLQIFANDARDELTWIMIQRWDTPADAHQFAAGYRYWLERRYRSVSDDGVCWIAASTHCIARIGDDETRVSSAPDSEIALALLGIGD